MLTRRSLALLAPVILSIPCLAQATEMPAWQKAAGGKMGFDVASVRLDTGDFKPPSTALSDDDGLPPRDGLFHSDFPVYADIEFAYKISLAPEQERALLATLPKWVKTERYDIQARSPGRPTKDQVRLMVRSLLEERFGLKVHFETQTVPAWAMTLVRPGKPGPKLIPLLAGDACSDSPPGPPSPDAKPGLQLCGSYIMDRHADGVTVFSSHKTTMALLASSLPIAGALGRPVVDQTGLTGDYSVTVEFSVEATRNAMRAAASPDGTGTAPESPPGITFTDAVREQLGLKLESTRAPVQMLVIDHIERPSEN